VFNPRRSRDLRADVASRHPSEFLILERRGGAPVAAWIREASDACLEGYRGELAVLGASALFDERLVRPFRIAQELHESVYAVRYLPSWRYVPDRALAAILGADP
jgi:maltokinase